MPRFLAGLAAGAAASGITYAVTQSPPWWWVIGLFVACLVWFLRPVVEAAVDVLDGLF